MIVSILTSTELLTTYRFYGARHPIVGLGNMVNFDIEKNAHFLPRLKDLMHLGFDWLMDRRRVYVWQQFVALFYAHLKDTSYLEPFYFDLLRDAAGRISLQNPKRVVVESYMRLLEHEGRLHLNNDCYICHQPLGDEVTLMRSFIPTHKECVYASEFDKKAVFTLFQSKRTLHLRDHDIQYLYNLVLKGL